MDKMENTPHKANRDPTDKSIPPPTITKVIPRAIMPLYDTCLKIFTRLAGFAKTSLVRAHTMNNTIRAR